ncbi:MAG: phage tail sheath subtilisin-like domain-containing protein, partial [Myxococcota bacterium]|nr:phage tail sheath subtilisin-like domain-containing protein [Myxococcota bacterium]
MEIVLRDTRSLWSHPDRGRFDPATLRAIRAFFDNGGDQVHAFGVCVESMDDLKSSVDLVPVLEPLLYRLRGEEDIALLLAPAAAYMHCSWNEEGDLVADVEPLYQALLAHCREMNSRFLVMDSPVGLHGAPLVRWVSDFRARVRDHSSYGALYYPWFRAGDDLLPPSGVMVGLYARIELERGVFGVVWPPANLPLVQVTGLEVELSLEEAGQLLEHRINPLVILPGRGAVAYGARTLSDEQGFDQINSRRIVNLVAEQLRRDNEWAVFEIHTPALWDILRRDVSFRLDEFWSAGLLSGETSGEQYTVKCDSENNPPALRDVG